MGDLNIDKINEQVRQLREAMTGVAAAMDSGEAIEKQPGWQALKAIPDRFPTHNGKPILVMSLAGPSGGGKSTIFKILTEINVPIGVKRPTSYNSIIAIPEQLDGTTVPEKLLKEAYSELKQLEDADQVRDRKLSKETLLYATYRENEKNAVHALIADIPDFNTVETSNWEKAEKMMSRADLIVFVAQADTYMDKDVIRVLHQCCDMTGKLAFVITKVNGETDEDAKKNARIIWEDLCTKTEKRPEFNIKRACGMTLCEFLRHAEVFFVPRKDNPRNEDFVSLHEDGKTLADIAMGLDAEKILREHLYQIAKGGLGLAAKLASDADKKRLKLEADIGKTVGVIEDVSKRIGMSEVPLGEILNLTFKTMQEARPKWLRYVSLPITAPVKWISSISKLIRNKIKQLKNAKNDPNLKNRNDLEKERLHEASSWLIDQWRKDFPELKLSTLSNATTASVREQFLSAPLPDIAEGDWQTFLRDTIRNWTKKHPFKNSIAGSISEVLAIIGGTVIVTDLFLGGTGSWLVIAFDQFAVWSLGGLSLSVVFRIFQALGIGSEIKEVQNLWSRQRGQELAQHITSEFAAPLFLQAWKIQLNKLNNAPIRECQELHAELSDQMKKEYRHG